MPTDERSAPSVEIAARLRWLGEQYSGVWMSREETVERLLTSWLRRAALGKET